MSIYINNINKSFNSKTVLNNFSMEIKEGSFNALLGESGIGKTTLVNIMLGILKPDSGQISGMDNQIISAVFQEDRLIDSYSALNNILLVCKKGGEERAKALNLLDQAGLLPHMDQPVSQLSGGMKRRVAILRAILFDHSFLILDEPFKGLDIKTKEKMMALVKCHEKGKTVLLITHNASELAFFQCIHNYM